MGWAWVVYNEGGRTLNGVHPFNSSILGKGEEGHNSIAKYSNAI
jgi:hypothetical protein